MLRQINLAAIFHPREFVNYKSFFRHAFRIPFQNCAKIMQHWQRDKKKINKNKTEKAPCRGAAYDKLLSACCQLTHSFGIPHVAIVIIIFSSSIIIIVVEGSFLLKKKEKSFATNSEKIPFFHFSLFIYLFLFTYLLISLFIHFCSRRICVFFQFFTFYFYTRVIR